jgi:very-short-patch-repair endonuclease
MFLYNDPKFKLRRKELRRNETKEEKLLWSSLRGEKLQYKFIRQCSVGPYILDFYCREKRIGVELDGFQHLDNKDYDKERDDYLLLNDIKILRFWNSEISANIDEVLEKIKKELYLSPPPNVGGGRVGV